MQILLFLRIVSLNVKFREISSSESLKTYESERHSHESETKIRITIYKCCTNIVWISERSINLQLCNSQLSILTIFSLEMKLFICAILKCILNLTILRIYLKTKVKILRKAIHLQFQETVEKVILWDGKILNFLFYNFNISQGHLFYI